MTRFLRALAGTCVALASLPAFAAAKPVISAMYPGSMTAGQPMAFEIGGTGFVSGAQVLVNGTVEKTLVVGDTLAAAYIATAPAKVKLEIRNPNGATSIAFTVPVTPAPKPVAPAISTVTPGTVTAGQAAIFQVAGSNFRSGAVVLLNGKAEPSVLVSSNIVSTHVAAVPSAVVITIENSDGTTSAAYKVMVNPAPKKSASSTPTTPTNSNQPGSGSSTTSSGSSTSSTGSTSTSSTGSTSTSSTGSTSTASTGTTYYVRPDGGTRYSTNMTSGQCDGLGDSAYSGVGVNQHCAFSSPHFLWQDGFYPQNPSDPAVAASFPSWGWIGQGGDTYLIRGSIGTGISYRIGWPNASASQNPGSNINYGIPGDPYGSGIPEPPSGTAAQPTRILGENYANCSSQSARTQLHAGFGVSTLLDLRSTSHVDVECLDMTDFADCILNGSVNTCNKNPGTLSDYADTAISWNNQGTYITLNNIRIHGFSASGMSGSPGNGVAINNIALIGNASSGWNMDGNDGTTGNGTLAVTNFQVSWNGCSEEYPIVDALPYDNCTDDNSGGYGDGIGTATVPSTPAWNITFSNGTVNYNTQDGLDFLHVNGPGSSVTETGILAYGNMGNQLKTGTGLATVQNDIINGNCEAMAHAIPGTPSDYNAQLSDFCRAEGAALALNVGNGVALTVENNTLYSDDATGYQITCDTSYGQCNNTAIFKFNNNIFVGFLNNVADGFPSTWPVTNNYSNPIYDQSDNGNWSLGDAGSQYTNNLTYHASSNWTCPGPSELHALCGVDPQLTDETWHIYGYPNVQPLSGSPVLGAGVDIPGLTLDFAGNTISSTPSIGAYQK